MKLFSTTMPLPPITTSMPTVLNPDAFLGSPRIWTPERNLAAWEEIYRLLEANFHQFGQAATLYIVCGIQGAGKSTWIGNNPDFFKAPAFVIDAALPAARHRARAMAFAAAHQVRAEAVWIDTPLEAALARNAGRAEDERVPEAAIANVHTMFEKPSIQEGFAVVHRLTSHA